MASCKMSLEKKAIMFVHEKRGELSIMDPNQQALIHSAFNDCHFTVLGFTAATGQPVCCAVIIACKELQA